MILNDYKEEVKAIYEENRIFIIKTFNEVYQDNSIEEIKEAIYDSLCHIDPESEDNLEAIDLFIEYKELVDPKNTISYKTQAQELLLTYIEELKNSLVKQIDEKLNKYYQDLREYINEKFKELDNDSSKDGVLYLVYRILNVIEYSDSNIRGIILLDEMIELDKKEEEESYKEVAYRNLISWIGTKEERGQ